MSGDAFWQDMRDEIAADPEYAQAHATDERQMSLTGFLVARIAEDEAEVRKWQERGVRWPARKVLAECEAKRRIVEVNAHPARNDDGIWGDGARATLELLALPYADHPDYREEWSV